MIFSRSVDTMGFFKTVQYAQELEDDSWLSKFEAAADVCRAPYRWLESEWNSENGKKYLMTCYDAQGLLSDELHVKEVGSKITQGIQKVMRVVAGLLFSLPGQIVAIPLMAVAYSSEEIRLKHKIAVRNLSDDEKQKLEELIDKRQELAKERQGCEPVSCLLFSICCLLCYLVCKK